MTRVDMLGNERLLDDRHHLHEFQDFWRERAVALVFLPQFGSAFGLAQAKELTSRFDQIKEVGADVVLIGIGTPIEGFTFRNRAASRFPVMATQDHTLYRTMGLARVGRTFRAVGNASALVSLVRGGTYPYQRTGDPNRLGGIFVVARGGEVVWEHRQRYAADIVSGQHVVDALVAAVEAGNSVVDK